MKRGWQPKGPGGPPPPPNKGSAAVTPEKISKANRPGTSEAAAYARDHDSDFFPTPPDVTEALIRAEAHILPKNPVIWEPACGDGAIAEVLKRHGFRVFSADLVNRGYGLYGIDFLQTKVPQGNFLITNPPYKDGLPEAFVRHAHRLGVQYVALLLKAQFWNVQSRVRLWSELRPAREYKLTWRPDFLGLGGGTMDCNWYVWDWRFEQPQACVPRLLLRPDSLGFEGVV